MAMRAQKQLIAGDHIGRWTLIQVAPPTAEHKHWLCQCECGTRRAVRADRLRIGASSLGCGCSSHRTHGETRGGRNTREYHIWQCMRARCSNPKNNVWYLYGARGISVCESWNKFENFLADMGRAPSGASIDRKNTLGNYEPDNCRWATAIEQARNTTSNRLIRVGGETRCLSEWAALSSVPVSTAHRWLKSGVSPAEVFRAAGSNTGS